MMSGILSTIKGGGSSGGQQFCGSINLQKTQDLCWVIGAFMKAKEGSLRTSLCNSNGACKHLSQRFELYMWEVCAQSYPTLCDSMNCSPPGSSVHGVLQARILEWITMPSSRGSSRPRDRTGISCVSCTAGGFSTHWATWEAHTNLWKLELAPVVVFIKLWIDFNQEKLVFTKRLNSIQIKTDQHIFPKWLMQTKAKAFIHSFAHLPNTEHLLVPARALHSRFLLLELIVW